jgi:holin-like protein
MIRAVTCFLALVAMICLKLLGDSLSHWMDLRVPGSFWGFLILWFVLSGRRQPPEALSVAADGLLNHLTLFLLPSLVAAVVGLKLVADATVLLAISGLLVTVAMAVVGGLVMSALNDRARGNDDA